MAATTGISSFGTLLKVGDGQTTETFATVAEVHDISGPGIKLDLIEATHHESPDATREFLPGLKDLSEVTFEIAFVPTNATHSLTTGFLKDWKDRTKRNYQLVFPDTGPTTWAFSGYVTGFNVKAPVDGLLTADVTIRLTGALTEVV